MCCISSCVLCKQTNTGLHWSAEWKSLKPRLGSAIWAQGGWGEWKGGGGGGGKVQHSLGCNNSRSPLRSFLPIPWRAQPIFINGGVHTPEHREERAKKRCQKPQLGWCQALGCSLLFNQDTQSWAFSSWSLCGTNQCGLGDRAPEQSLQAVIYWLFLLFIDWFFQSFIFFFWFNCILCAGRISWEQIWALKMFLNFLPSLFSIILYV